MNERAIFMEALEKETPAERSAYLGEACGSDAALRQRLEALLTSHEQAGSFLGKPVPERLAEKRVTPGGAEETEGAPSANEGGPGPSNDEAAGPRPITEGPGSRIGPYKLLQQIGEGGMGTVFMAEQTHPVQRKVALKLIKSGMDSRQVIARFEAERQALAMMDHVNIARVFDGGATENGRPYFVMELVHGVPITKYCDDNHLTPRERLELFVPVCQAIQHAHQKGIIHRDLKPSNVMVTLYDGKPVPKVIDFGVAKATEQKLTDRTLFTQYGTMVGTLEYMSPEQAEMSALGVDTRSDIYSLGVLLYELLTGSTPLTHKRIKEAAYAEILRMIRDVEPPRPSTRLSDSGEALASISAHRKTEPAKLSKLMRGELDWIVMKALDKDRTRRYETANSLAMDVQHYLADEPVHACPESNWYRLRKFIRRNKGPVLAASLVLLALLGGIIGTTWGMLRATDAEAKAVKVAKQKEQALGAARAQSHYGAAHASARGGQPTDAEVYFRRSIALWEKVLTDFVETEPGAASPKGPPPRAQLQDALARTHHDLAIVLRERRRMKEAEAHFGVALATWERLIAEAPDEPLYRFHVIWMYTYHMSALYREEGRAAELLAGYQKAAELISTVPAERFITEGRGSPAGEYYLFSGMPTFDDRQRTRWRRDGVCDCYRNVIDLLVADKRLAEAARVYQQWSKLCKDFAASFPDQLWPLQDASRCHLDVGHIFSRAGHKAESEAAFRAAVAIHEQMALEFAGKGEARGELVDTHANAARQLQDEARLEEAPKVARLAIAARETLVDDPANQSLLKHADLVNAYLSLSEFLGRAGKVAEAENVLRRGLKFFKEREAQSSESAEYQHEHGRLHNHLGLFLSATHRLREAEQAHRRALTIYETLLPKVGYAPRGCRQELMWTCENLGNLLAREGRPAEAEKAHRQAIAECEKLNDAFPGAYSGWLGHHWFRLATVLQAQQRSEEAVKAMETILELQPAEPRLLNDAAWCIANRPGANPRAGEQAVRLARKAVDLCPSDGTFWNTLGVAHYRAGAWALAIRSLERSQRLPDDKNLGLGRFFLAMAHWRLNEKESARKWYDRAVNWMEKHMPRDDELRRFRSDAEEVLELKKK